MWSHDKSPNFVFVCVYSLQKKEKKKRLDIKANIVIVAANYYYNIYHFLV